MSITTDYTKIRHYHTIWTLFHKTQFSQVILTDVVTSWFNLWRSHSPVDNLISSKNCLLLLLMIILKATTRIRTFWESHHFLSCISMDFIFLRTFVVLSHSHTFSKVPGYFLIQSFRNVYLNTFILCIFRKPYCIKSILFEFILVSWFIKFHMSLRQLRS